MAPDELGWDAEAGVGGVRAAGEDGRDDLSFGVDGGAAGVAGPDKDAEGGDDAFDGALVVGIAGDHALRLARAGGPDVERAVLREAYDGRRLAESGEAGLAQLDDFRPA